MNKGTVQIDVIILSFAKDDALKALTDQTVRTLIASEDPEKIQFNVIVVESNKLLSPYQFPHSKTLYPKENFGYNRFMNIGIRATSGPYVCLCNNDLIFHRGWATAMIETLQEYPMLSSMNPLCDVFKYSVPIKNNQIITGNRHNMFKSVLTGWCIFVKRDIFQTIGLFDEQFEFWYADRDYGKTILKYKVRHALVTRSKVTHLGNRSHHTLKGEELGQMTTDQKIIYEKKWGKDQPDLIFRIWRKLRLMFKQGGN